ncbi:unnamed protein product [Closterium sp. NIES-65]|nr:unnamed protein product [Closterium sp. NIES-65]
MAITIYFIATSLRDRLASVRDALLLKHPSELTIEVLESALKDVESNLRLVASASGAVPPLLFHGCTVPQLPSFTPSLANATTDVTAAAVTASSRSRGRGGKRGGQGTGGSGGGGVGGGGGGRGVPTGGGGSAGPGEASRAAVSDSPTAAGGGDTRARQPPSGLPAAAGGAVAWLLRPLTQLCLGRLRATPQSSSLRPATKPFETLHLDIWGLASCLGPECERFFLVVVDDYSRYTTVFPLAKKSEVTSTLIRWLLTTEGTRGRRLSCLHSGRGGEFHSGILTGLCREQGIRQSWTLPQSPQQNGVAERRIGLVMEIAHAPHFLWPYAVRYVAHQLNL